MVRKQSDTEPSLSLLELNSQHDDGLAATLREIQSLEGQLQKDQKKLEGASSKKAGQAQSKAMETQRNLDQTLELWEMEAPFAFEAYQKIDLQRLELMKEAVTRFETAQSDAAQRLMAVSEQTLQAVLTFDPQAEQQEFVLKNGAGTGATPARRAPPSQPGRLQRNDSVASSARMTPTRRGTLNGLSTPTRADEFGAGSSSASVHSTEQTQRARGGGGGTLKSAFSRFGKGRSNKNAAESSSTTYGNLPEDPSENDMRRTMTPETTSSSRRAPPGPPMGALDESSPLPPSRGFSGDRLGTGIGGGLMQPMTPNSRSNATNGAGIASQAAAASPAPPPVDAEGYSIPPPDRKPWQGTSSNNAALMDEEDEEVSDLAAPSQRMSTMNISSAPVARPSSAQDEAALERMRSTLLGAAPARRATTSRRDRRDVRNTTYNPMAAMETGSSQFGAIPAQATGASSTSGIASPTLGGFTGQPGLGRERTQSIVSTSSAQAAASGNPFEASPGSAGLRASITETVNAILTNTGVARLMITGEVSLNVRDVPTIQPLHLRLGSFEQLEKAAPNPAFLQAVVSKPGEYTLDVANLARQASGSSGNAQGTILKYQLHVPVEKMTSYLPLTVDAKWRFESHQTSFLLNYTPNQECRLSSSTSTTQLQNLSFVVSVGPSNVSSVTSKPEGSWNSEQKHLHWKIEEPLSLSSSSSNGTGPGKLLARFQVDGEGQVKPVFVRWRIAGSTISNLGLDLVDSVDGLVFEEVARQTVSGKYIAQ